MHLPARFEQLESRLIAALCQVARGLAESSGLQMDSASLEAGRVLALCRLDSGKAVSREQWREKMASLEAGAFKDFAAADPLVASAVAGVKVFELAAPWTSKDAPLQVNSAGGLGGSSGAGKASEVMTVMDGHDAVASHVGLKDTARLDTCVSSAFRPQEPELSARNRGARGLLNRRLRLSQACKGVAVRRDDSRLRALAEAIKLVARAVQQLNIHSFDFLEVMNTREMGSWPASRYGWAGLLPLGFAADRDRSMALRWPFLNP